MAILRKLKKNLRQQTLLYSGAGSLIHPSVVLTAANKHHTTAMDIIRGNNPIDIRLILQIQLSF